MMLIINGKVYDGKLSKELLSTIKAEIKKLPQPKIIPMDEKQIKADDAVLTLQRESAYIDQLASVETKQYLGTKHLAYCILIYLRTTTDHAVVHVDYTRKLNLHELIKQFNNQDNIHVTLIGGNDSETSNDNINAIIQQLFEISKNCHITIDAQKILENNQDVDRHQQAYDFFSRNGRMLYHYLFNELPEPTFLSEMKTSHFKESTEGDIDKMMEMTFALSDPALTIDPVYRKKMLDNKQPMTIQNLNKQEFMELLKTSFSDIGFLYFKQCIVKVMKNSFINAHLANFVFDLKSRNIHVIPENTYTPNEADRMMRNLDPQTLAQGCELRYNNREYGYIKPRHNKALFFILAKLKNTLAISNIVKFSETINEHPQSRMVYCARQFLTQEQDNRHNLSAHSLSFFNVNKKQNDIYSQEIVESDCTKRNIASLKKITNVDFTAKMRFRPKYTIDALFQCQTPIGADMIMKQLNEYTIHSHIMTLADNQLYVCVPAINVNHYYKEIVSADVMYRSSRLG